MSKNPIIATTFFDHPNIKGIIDLYEDLQNNQVIIKGQLKSNKFKNSYHGFHVHEAGDLSDSCMGACAHFNPYNKNHGGRNSKDRHVGDLGNITSKNKTSKGSFYDSLISLVPGHKCNIVGRSIIVHKDKDDLGKGNNEESLKTGNAGKRLACGVIGISN